MSQSSIMSEFRSAYEIGQSKHVEELTLNPILETVQQFANDKRIGHFVEDLPGIVNDTVTGALIDANRLREAAAELDLLIKAFSKMKARLLEQSENIINDKQRDGVTVEGNFKIEPIISNGTRTADVKTLKTMKEEWDLLVGLKVKKVKDEYAPTQADLKTIFGKSFEKYLLPGLVTITGYDIKPISAMPEQASTRVEL